MAQHELKITELPVLEIKHKDVVFLVKADDGVIGHLHISKGRIEWKLKYGIYHYSLRWREFAELALKYGKKKKHLTKMYAAYISSIHGRLLEISMNFLLPFSQ